MTGVARPQMVAAAASPSDGVVDDESRTDGIRAKGSGGWRCCAGGGRCRSLDRAVSTGDCCAERVAAVVSPADRLLGRHVALELVRRGLDVALIGEDESILREITLAVLHVGGRALALKTDSSCEETLSGFVKEVHDRLGPVGVWVDLECEGLAFDEPNSGTSSDDRPLGTRSVSWGLSEVAAVMSEGRDAMLVSVESTRAFVPCATRPELCAAAFARRGLFASLRRQALTSGSNVSFCSVYASNLPSGCADDDDRVARQFGRIARAVGRSAVDGRRQRFDSMASRRAVDVARLLPGLVEQWRKTESADTSGLGRWDWHEVRRAAGAWWREMVRGWLPVREGTR